MECVCTYHVVQSPDDLHVGGTLHDCVFCALPVLIHLFCFHSTIDFKMESVLPPSMMTMNRASAVSESDESTDQLPLDDVPPRPHSAITFSGQITPSQGRPSSGQDVSSPGGRGSFAGPPYSSPTTKKEFSLPGRCNFDRRRNETGMKRLLNLSAQAMRHRSSTLPRPLTASPSTDPLQTSSSATSLKPQVKKDCILEEGQMRKTCSMPSRGNPSLDKTDGEDASEKNPMEITREVCVYVCMYVRTYVQMYKSPLPL